MAKKPKPMHVLEIPIAQVDGFPHPRNAFNTPFHILWKIHNIAVAEAQRRLDRLFRDREYWYLIRRLKKAESKDEKKAIAERLTALREKYDLAGSYCLQKYVAVQQHRYRQYFSTHQIQKEGEAVYKGVDKVLFVNGKRLHFRKASEIRSISQKDTSNGVKFNTRTGVGTWRKFTFRCHINWNDPYVAETLAYGDIAYYEIKRRMFKSGWRYYLVIVIRGHAPKKISDAERKRESLSDTGIDLGTSTLAAYSHESAELERLAPDAESYDRRIRQLQKKYDRLQCINNPENYNPDGTVRKGRKTWHRSNRMRQLRRKISTLYRKKSEYIRMCHCLLANKLIMHADHIYYEKNCFASMQRRAKKTERSEKVSVIRRKDGALQNVRKFRKKKRFGHSLALYAPALFITLLKNKCLQYDVPFDEINTSTYRASQYDPLTGEYRKPALSERFKNIEGHQVQRDLLSAYLIAHPDPSLMHADTSAVYENFSRFLKLHDACIQKMKDDGISFRQCFGF
ncbi:MAG: hypothetical protein PUA69_01840 [Erysipelotrichaceae bacterium]|nr:hypothetical protein [Erysipelotrichaceae bacterium]